MGIIIDEDKLPTGLSCVMSSLPLELESIALIKQPLTCLLWENALFKFAELIQSLKSSPNRMEPSSMVLLSELYLQQFPSQSAYWEDRSSEVARLDGPQKAELVLEEALGFLGYDIHLWLTYLQLKLSNAENTFASNLEVIDEARQRIGMHFYCSEFYELYFSFLQMCSGQSNLCNLKKTGLARQLSCIPLYDQALLYPQVSLRKIPERKHVKQRCDAIQQNVLAQQAYCARIFPFEREVIALESPLLQATGLWRRYIHATKGIMSVTFMVQLYERALLVTGNDIDLVCDYSNYLLRLGKTNKVRTVLKRALTSSKTVNRIRILTQLIKLELSDGNFLRARDYIAQYLSCNRNAPHELWELLFIVERLF